MSTGNYELFYLCDLTQAELHVTYKYLESSLHVTVIIMLGSPQASFQVVKNKSC